MYRIFETKSRRWVSGTHVDWHDKPTAMFNKNKKMATSFSCRRDAGTLASKLGHSYITVADDEVIIEILSYNVIRDRFFEVDVPELVAIPLNKIEDEDYIDEYVTDASGSDTPDWVEFYIDVDWYEVIG